MDLINIQKEIVAAQKEGNFLKECILHYLDEYIVTFYHPVEKVEISRSPMKGILELVLFSKSHSSRPINISIPEGYSHRQVFHTLKQIGFYGDSEKYVCVS